MLITALILGIQEPELHHFAGAQDVAKAPGRLRNSEAVHHHLYDKGRLRSRPEFGLGVLGLGFGAVPAAQGEVK